MTKVFIAGPYGTGPDLQSLSTVSVCLGVVTELLEAGFYPFVPWKDYMYRQLLRGDFRELPSDRSYRDYCKAWIEVSDCVLVIGGCAKDNHIVDTALALGKPVYYSVEELKHGMYRGKDDYCVSQSQEN